MVERKEFLGDGGIFLFISSSEEIFREPFKDTVLLVNNTLLENRYPPINSPYANWVIVDLDSDTPKLSDEVDDFSRYDYLQLEYNLGNEELSPADKLLAYLGSQGLFWTGLDNALNQRRLDLADWDQYVLVPVFKIDGEYHLLMKRRDNGFFNISINFSGDGDMIHSAREKAMTRNGLSVPFSDLSIEDSDLDRYIELRGKIHETEQRAITYAIEQMKGQQAWVDLKRVFPEIDKYFTPTSNYSFGFIREIETLLDNIFEGVSGLKTDLLLAVGSFLIRETRIHVNRFFIHQSDFKQNIYELGELLCNMACLDSRRARELILGR